MEHTGTGFGTQVIHSGVTPGKDCRPLSMPIYQTSTFYFDTCEQGGRCFAGEESGYYYSRMGNPTVQLLEEKNAALEGAETAVATGSGMGAISSALWSIAGAGKHILADKTLYGCTFALLSHGMTRYGVEVTFIDTSDLKAVEENLRENTCAVYLETPANPTLKIADIQAVARIAHGYDPNIKVVVDNTFATPYLQRPLELGADMVVHSATKFLNGHGDALGGVVIGRADDIRLIRANSVTKINGCPPSPFNSYLVLRGMKTLALRMKQHCASAMEIARYLEANPYVKAVYYPGLESHPQHELASRQMENGMYGGMISFELKDDVKGLSSFEAGKKLLNSLKIPAIAVSLGDPDSLIEHPASMTHANVSPEDRLAAGITDGLIRLSVGLESAKDLIADFEQAFAAI